MMMNLRVLIRLTLHLCPRFRRRRRHFVEALKSHPRNLRTPRRLVGRGSEPYATPG